MNQYYLSSATIGAIGLSLICAGLKLSLMVSIGCVLVIIAILMMLDFIRENTTNRRGP